MNSKEVFEKIKSSITEALNKEDGIMLAGKELKFYQQMDLEARRSVHANPYNVEVHVYTSEESKPMWYVNIHNALYEMAAAEYFVEELKKTFGERVLISYNLGFSLKGVFQIAITFGEGQIENS